jgi:hypothetical protein
MAVLFPAPLKLKAALLRISEATLKLLFAFTLTLLTLFSVERE